MSIFEQVLSHMAKRADKLDGDYYKDELLYCGKCNKPKEKYFTIGELPERIVSIACDCVKAIQDEEDRQEKINRRRESIEESIRGLVELGVARMPRFNFSMCDGLNKALQERMEKYAKNFDQVYDKNIGLILFGDTGCGKTFFAECIADALIKKGRFALLTSVSGIVNAMTTNFNNQNGALLNYIKNVDLLILDDYGTERDTSFMNERMYDIIDARYTANRPMIITTNLSPQQMQNDSDIHVKRIIDRLTEACVAIEVKGVSKRPQKGTDKMLQFKEILKGG